MLVFKRLTAVAVTIGALLAGRGSGLGWARPAVGLQLGFQQSATPVMDEIIKFHTGLFYVITAITGFVLALLLIVMCAFNAAPIDPIADHAQYVGGSL